MSASWNRALGALPSAMSCLIVCAAGLPIGAQSFDQKIEPTRIYSAIDTDGDGDGDISKLSSGSDVTYRNPVISTNGSFERACFKFDLGDLTASDLEQVTLGGLIYTDPATAGTFPATFRVIAFGSNGGPWAFDYEAAGTTVGTFVQDGGALVDFGVDLTAVVDSLLSTGTTHLGIRIELVEAGRGPSNVDAFAGSIIGSGRVHDPVLMLNVRYESSTPSPTPAAASPFASQTSYYQPARRALEFHGTDGQDAITIERTSSGGTDVVRIADFSSGTVIAERASAETDSVRIFLYGGNDTVVASAMFDRPIYVQSGDGADVITTGIGDDVIYGGNGNDQIDAGGGRDAVYGEFGDDDLDGNDNDDLLVGGWGDDTIQGDDGSDLLHGGPGDDTLQGQAGDDSIVPGLGTDSIYGGTGSDRLVKRVIEGEELLDLDAEDAIIRMYDAGNTNHSGTQYEQGVWEDYQLERANFAFDWLFRETCDNEFMYYIDTNVPGGDDFRWLEFFKIGPPISGPQTMSGDSNSATIIRLWHNVVGSDPDVFTRPNLRSSGTIIHEIGHAWEGEYDPVDWQSRSGWVTNPSDTTGLVQLPNMPGSQWVRDDAKFVSNYATTAWFEDFPESFEAYTWYAAGRPDSTWDVPSTAPSYIASIDQIPEKLSYMEDMFEDIGGFTPGFDWYEQFTGISNGSISDPGATSWTTNSGLINVSNPVYGVQNNAFEFSDVADQNDNGYVIWRTSFLTVNAAAPTTVTFDVSAFGGLDATGTSNDFIRAKAVVSGGGSTTIFDIDGAGALSSTPTTFTHTFPSGATQVRLQIEAKTTETSERYVLDNVRFEQLPSAGSCEASPIPLIMPAYRYELDPLDLTVGQTSAPGTTGWSYDTSDVQIGSPVYGVATASGGEKVFEFAKSANDGGGGLLRWKTGLMTVFDYDGASVHFAVRGSGNLDESGSGQDWLRVYAVVNTTNPVSPNRTLVGEWIGDVPGQWQKLAADVPDNAGNFMLVVESKVTASGEYYELSPDIHLTYDDD
ncbi:MAG: calcium-binding protein [Planctomycetota bacterium]